MIRKISSNFFSLVGVQLISAIFGIVTVPIIINKIGIADFGVFSVLLSLGTMASLIVDFGINISGVNSISKLAGNKLKSYIASYFIIRLFIFSIIAVISLFFAFISESPYSYLLVLFLSAGSVFQINYYLKSIEKMWVITIVTFSQRFISLTLIFLVEDMSLDNALICYSLPFFLVSFCSFFLITNRLSDFDVTTDIKLIKKIFFNSFHMFIGVFGSALYRNMTIPLFSMFLSLEVVGYYSAAEKMLKGIQGLVNSGAEAIYPTVCKSSYMEAYYKNILIVTFGTTLLITSISSILLYEFGYVFSLTNNTYSILILLTLSIGLSIGSVCFFMGVMYFFARGFQKDFSIVTVKSGCISICLICVLGWVDYHSVMLLSPFLTELMIFLMLLAKMKILYSKDESKK
ncbi:oligosaccharide flippase family protein [Vibrio sp. Y184]|uniref:oligosaccharide flippase family protein n=1 Tax=Vibrio sp. Y184 TaxID=3074705 RepID=UPI0029663C7B|nr:oligosaccharide flippase family protein [Vibrio sp. Y184]MDW3167946.1 oligosaccharide flippase family protein [Vibrio sp. Y184]